MTQKKNLLILLGLILLPLLFLNFSNFNFFKSSKQEVTQHKFEPGVFVEFMTPPLFLKQVEILKNNRLSPNDWNKKLIRQTLVNSSPVLRNQKEKILNEQKDFVSGLFINMKRTEKSPPVTIMSFSDQTNAIYIRGISFEDIKKHGDRVPQVKRVSMELEFKYSIAETKDIIHFGDLNSSIQSSALEPTGFGVRIGVLDSGFDYTHKDLKGFGFGQKIVDGFDYYGAFIWPPPQAPDADPMDQYGHGTHVAGIIAGKTYVAPMARVPPNMYKGIAPDATLYGYKLGSTGPSFPALGLLLAMGRCSDPNGDGMIDDHLDICNLSAGSLPTNSSDIMSDTAGNVVDTGVLFVAAAGNDGPASMTVGTPGTSPKVLTVANACKPGLAGSFDCTSGSQINSGSSRGPVINSTISKPDIAAPGTRVCSALFPDLGNFIPVIDNCGDTEHVLMYGTSMSAPVVTGAGALMLQLRPELAPSQIKSIMMSSADNLGEDPYIQGTGMLDIHAAMQSAGLPNPQIKISGSKIKILHENSSNQITTYQKYITFKNVSAANKSLSLNNYSIVNGIQTTVTPSTVVLSPGQEQEVQISFNIDQTVVEPGVHSMKFRFQTPNSNGKVYTYFIPAVVEVQKHIQAPAVVDFGVLSHPNGYDPWIDPDPVFSHTIQLQNLVPFGFTYDVSYEKDELPGAPLYSSNFMVDLNTSSISFGPNQSGSVVMNITFDNEYISQGWHFGKIRLSNPNHAIVIPTIFYYSPF